MESCFNQSGANVAKLVDALDLGSSGVTLESSSLSFRTNESKESIKRSALSVIRYPEPIDWDGNEVLFALGIAGYQGGHMDILSRIAIVFSDTDEVDKLVAARSAQELYDLLNAVNEG